MNWRQCTLGELIRVKHGWAFKGEFFTDTGKYIVLTPGNFNEKGGFRLRPGKDRAYSDNFPEAYILKEGDVIVAMTEQAPGLLGCSAWIPESDRFLHNQRLGLVQPIDESLVDMKFIYHLFNTANVRGQLSGSASGTKVRHTAPERIGRVVVKIPDILSQRKIAETISTYDDLIENNRRRIDLLEQSARLLYKEWFVSLRFPGHEHVKVKDGVPQGWEKKSFGAIVNNFDNMRVPLSVLEREKRPGVYPYHGAAGILDHIDEYIFDGRYLLIGEDGTVITPSQTPMLQFVEGKFWVSNHAHVIQGKEVSTEFIYCFLRQYPISGHITGVAQPKITQGNLNRIEVLVPTQPLLVLFQEFIDSIISQEFTLRLQNQKLQQARDLLLPRLMNGEIPV